MTIITEENGRFVIDREQVRKLVAESGVLKALKVIETFADSGQYPPDFVEQIERVMFEIEFDEQFHNARKV